MSYFWQTGFPGLHPAAALWACGLTVFSLALFMVLFYRQREDRESLSSQWLRGVVAFLLGGLLFAPSIIYFQIPLQETVAGWLMSYTTITGILILQFPVIMVSGLIQEPVKFLAVLTTGVRSNRDHYLLLGALAGAGYGGVEALLLLSTAFYHPGVTAANLAVAIVERCFAVLFHLSLTALAAYFWSRSRLEGLKALLAVAVIHSLVNYIVISAMFFLGLLVQVLFGLIVAGLFYYLWKRVKKTRGELNEL